MADGLTQIAAVVCNNDTAAMTSYTVVLERDGVFVKVPRWSCVHAISGTQRLANLYDTQLADRGAMDAGELRDMFGFLEDISAG